MNKLLQKEFGFQQVKIKKLNGYDNLNYLIITKAGKYIFKTYLKNTESLALAEAENETLLALQKPQNDKFPRPIQFTDGSFIKCIEIAGKETICRMLSFLEGQPLTDATQSKSLFQSLGTFLAQMDIELQSFNNYTIKARQWEWNIQYLNLNKKYIADITGAKNRNLVRYYFQQFEENVAPVLPYLRKAIIHNDANEWNVLVTNGKVSGIIDFGDLAYTALINELAVAIAYACFDKENPLEWASIILKSYHRLLPIKENEIPVLYYLIAARLCISVCNSAHSKKINADNEYAFVSEKSAWKLLYQWLSINPIAAKNCFRSAIGLTATKPKPVDKMIKARHAVISPILSLSYSKPIPMKKAAFQYMYDAYGNTYLDAYNNIPHVGHSHPQVVEAAQTQIAKLNTNTRYLYDLLPEYAERLLAKFPTSLNKVYFVNSGSAASDLAIRLAQAYTGFKNLMVIEHGYHGNTQIGMDISDYKFGNKAGQGQKKHILKTVIPDTYRGKYTINDGSAGKMYALEALEQIKHSDSPIAAFISEPILGCAGQVPLAKGYLKEIYPAIRKQGGVCISDEVQTGFGRLGDYFWGYEAQAVVPDIVIIGKPMGNGHPMGAVITTTEIADSFSKGVEFFSSFGGNPISCAIGLAVLDVIEAENLQENARIVGEFYKSLFINLQKEFPCIGDVRGSGLFIGIEIVKNNNSSEPDTELANLIKNELRNQNILIGTDGPFDSVLKTKPPLCFAKTNAQQVTDHIYGILETY
ncbi:MAG: aminotransferase class III-fold pyridoxal phosphate-dependent enzyme [Candidatus Marinimicrobia bacterium]|nr:aminotransferase class III-fold pyridoxal phosphate-dependent enzyme [Candidatus Neomarinimicrobiota bacterium]